MNILRAAMVALAVVTVGCSSADDDGANKSEGAPDPGAAPATTAPVANAPPATPPTTDAGPSLAASPIEQCEGYYKWAALQGPTSFEGWLHRTAEGCELGQAWVLLPGGRGKWSDREDDGTTTWSGDRFYFTVKTTVGGKPFEYFVERQAEVECD